jgi:hypothetical protein
MERQTQGREFLQWADVHQSSRSVIATLRGCGHERTIAKDVDEEIIQGVVTLAKRSRYICEECARLAKQQGLSG